MVYFEQVKKIKIKKLNNNIDLDTINRRLAVLGPAGERDLAGNTVVFIHNNLVITILCVLRNP